MTELDYTVSPAPRQAEALRRARLERSRAVRAAAAALGRAAARALRARPAPVLPRRAPAPAGA
jgi:hypothetical protein